MKHFETKTERAERELFGKAFLQEVRYNSNKAKFKRSPMGVWVSTPVKICLGLMLITGILYPQLIIPYLGILIIAYILTKTA